MILLDTHVWIWHVAEPRRLSTRARLAIAEAKTIGVSAISCWEVSMLAASGRVILDRDLLVWMRQALAVPRVELWPLSPEIAARSVALGAGFPGDPADRIISASALHRRATLITKDRRLRAVAELRTVW